MHSTIGRIGSQERVEFERHADLLTGLLGWSAGIRARSQGSSGPGHHRLL